MQTLRGHQVYQAFKLLFLCQYLQALYLYQENLIDEEFEARGKTASRAKNQETDVCIGGEPSENPHRVKENGEVKLGPASESLVSMNLYQAFNMNPFNFIDPMGTVTDFNYFVSKEAINKAAAHNASISTREQELQNLKTMGIFGAGLFASAAIAVIAPEVLPSLWAEASTLIGPTLLYNIDKVKEFGGKSLNVMNKVADIAAKTEIVANNFLSAQLQHAAESAEQIASDYNLVFDAASKIVDPLLSKPIEFIEKVFTSAFGGGYRAEMTGRYFADITEGFIKDSAAPLPVIGKNTAETIGIIANQISKFGSTVWNAIDQFIPSPFKE